MESITIDSLRDPWVVFGIVFQLFFFARFIVQWLASERAKRSIVPKSFWYLSIIGSLGLLVYSIHIQSLVFILGMSLNSLIYVRNLTLYRGV
jgi:lipid-A-disaccharide synthase-like uncharacterized protein